MRKSDSLTKRTVKNMIFYSAAVREMKEEILHSSRTATTKIEDSNWDEVKFICSRPESLSDFYPCDGL